MIQCHPYADMQKREEEIEIEKEGGNKQRLYLLPLFVQPCDQGSQELTS